MNSDNLSHETSTVSPSKLSKCFFLAKKPSTASKKITTNNAAIPDKSNSDLNSKETNTDTKRENPEIAFGEMPIFANGFRIESIIEWR